MTALVTSAVTLVTVLFSLFSMDSMFRPDLAAEVRYWWSPPWTEIQFKECKKVRCGRLNVETIVSTIIAPNLQQSIWHQQERVLPALFLCWLRRIKAMTAHICLQKYKMTWSKLFHNALSLFHKILQSGSRLSNSKYNRTQLLVTKHYYFCVNKFLKWVSAILSWTLTSLMHRLLVCVYIFFSCM